MLNKIPIVDRQLQKFNVFENNMINISVTVIR